MRHTHVALQDEGIYYANIDVSSSSTKTKLGFPDLSDPFHIRSTISRRGGHESYFGELDYRWVARNSSS